MNNHETERQEILKRIYSLKQISYNLSVSTMQVFAVTEGNLAIDGRTLRKHVDKSVEIVNEITNRYTQLLGELLVREDFDATLDERDKELTVEIEEI
jgi:hypothetical protein